MKTEGVAAFTNPGVDFLAGSNVMAIVVGIKNSAFPAGSGAVDTNGHKINVQKTWGSSERINPSINAGVTGSWYNPEQSGQGWVIEKISTGQFVFYFYGYDDTGELLWLLGLADYTGDSSIAVDVLRFSGTGFGGNFDPASGDNESVGSMTFNFTDCNNATVDFTPTSSDLSAFSMPAQRLTSIKSVDCVFLSEGQVDRVGRPFGNWFVPDEKKDAYNTASDPDTWFSLFNADIIAILTAIDLADGMPKNAYKVPSELSPVLADDRLKVDFEWAACLGVWGFETSELVPQPHTNNCGGRGLAANSDEEVLSMVISGFDPVYDDNVTANDVAFLTESPFLAPPHQ
ncbi:MAG TPA: hypothetical protein VIS57_07855 [Xanthomonadales bacterium]